VEKIQRERKIANVLVSHHMEDVARYANRVLVLHEGSLVLSGTPQEVFTRTELLEEIGIGVPQITSVTAKLKKAGIPLAETAVTLDQEEDLILRAFGRKGGTHHVS
jgi:energy-coupling factor transport system ATP-binding protein